MLIGTQNSACNFLHLHLRSSASTRLVTSHNRLKLKTRRLYNMSSGNDAAETFVAAIDQGTSSSRVIIYNSAGKAVSSCHQEIHLIKPSPGLVEQKATDLLESVKACLKGALAKAKEKNISIPPSSIKAVGITNQRETTVVWDNKTGAALNNTIVWSDARTHTLVAELIKKYEGSGGVDRFRKTTGLPISTYFSALKMRWLIDNVPEVSEAVKRGDALFGTVDSWLIWNLTGGVHGGAHLTDVTNASRTLLLNLETLKWDKDIAAEFQIPVNMLPEIRSSAEVYGRIVLDDVGDFKGVPITGCLGDQQSALVGQNCLQKGLAKSTYGTGCFLLFNTGEEPVQSKHGLLTTVGYQLGPKAPVVYALEGSISTAGSGLDWFKGTFFADDKDIKVKDLLAKAEGVENDEGDGDHVAFVPSFNGLLAPYWRPDARAVISGLSFSTSRERILRALIESIAHQGNDVLNAMKLDSKSDLKSLKVDGGLSRSDLLMQIQANFLGSEVQRPEDIESTARGAAYAAGVGAGLFSVSSDSHPMLDQELTSFTPKIDDEARARDQKRWDEAVRRSLGLPVCVDSASK